jgi:hypothetical protein
MRHGPRGQRARVTTTARDAAERGTHGMGRSNPLVVDDRQSLRVVALDTITL